MPLRRFRRQFEQQSQFERGRIIDMMEAGGQLGKKTSAPESHHILRNARIQTTASSATIQAHVAPSLGGPVSSRTIRKRLAEGHLRLQRPLRVLHLTPTHRRLIL
ncbi:uncharacterized protein TNCV_3141171 [Trichonephila clavipes]|nr:uncharacterized protein TNCV_3141171 [Trichonephila clavipes]